MGIKQFSFYRYSKFQCSQKKILASSLEISQFESNSASRFVNSSYSHLIGIRAEYNTEWRSTRAQSNTGISSGTDKSSFGTTNTLRFNSVISSFHSSRNHNTIVGFCNGSHTIYIISTASFTLNLGASNVSISANSDISLGIS